IPRPLRQFSAQFSHHPEAEGSVPCGLWRVFRGVGEIVIDIKEVVIARYSLKKQNYKMKDTATGAGRSEPRDGEQDGEDVYEVESIVDMRVEEGEILYRVRWKNYTADDDTWEPEANLEDCLEVLLAFRKKQTEGKPKTEPPEVEVATQEVGTSAVQAVVSRCIVGAQEEEEQVQVTATGLLRDLVPKETLKSDQLNAGSENDVVKRDASSLRKKRKSLAEDLSSEMLMKTNKKEKRKSGRQKAQPGPESEGIETEEEVPNTAPLSPHVTETKRALESDDDEAIKSKKRKKKSIDSETPRRNEAKDGGNCKKGSQRGKKRKEHEDTVDSSEEEVETEKGTLSKDSELQPAKAIKPAGKRQSALEDEPKTPKVKPKQSRPGPKLQESEEPPAPAGEKESTRQKLKNLMRRKSQSAAIRGGVEDEPSHQSSDSSDAVISVKRRSRALETSILTASSSPSSPSSSSSAAGQVAKEDEAKLQGGVHSSVKGEASSSAKLEDSVEKDLPTSTNLFEKFLLNCEAKDRLPRKQNAHPTAPENRAEQTKATTLKTSKAEKKTKTSKDSQAQKPQPDRTEKVRKEQKVPEALRRYRRCSPGEEREGKGNLTTKQEKGGRTTDRRERTEARVELKAEETAEFTALAEVPECKVRGEEQREGTGNLSGCRSERPLLKEEGGPRRAKERRKREDSEPRLYIACDDNQDSEEPLRHTDRTKELTPADREQTSLDIGVELKLDWMTLEDFQKHLNGENEIVSAAVLSPSELRDAVKSGDYLTVKLALISKEDYNLDQEDSSGMSLIMLAAAGGQDDILRLLIRRRVKVNGRQKNGTTALMHAAEKNFLTTVAILLEAGAHVNARTLGGETALMKACKRGNTDVVRLLLEQGADCNILSKHQNNALQLAKLSNNITVYDHVKDHMNLLSSVAQDTVRAYFESRLTLQEPIFPLACHRLCESPDFSLEFNYKPPPHSPEEGSGILLFIFHANFLREITARLCGPCGVHAVVLNDKFQLPIFLDTHFIYSFSPAPGTNKLFIRLADSPTAKVKLLICAYNVQVQ
ncbi:hypothetical protein GJAV_G00213130, partial [Gymnothorax javanicus]